MICSFKACDMAVKCKGMCLRHYKRAWKYKDTNYKSRLDYREPIIQKNYTLIPLNKEQTLFAKVDKDSPAIGRNWYSYQGHYPTTRIDGKSVGMHNYLCPNIPQGMVVDHINRDKLDNRLENLRIVTRSENSANRQHSNNKSGYRGVIWDSYNQRWYAFGKINGKRYSIKNSRDIQVAINARLAWEEAHNVPQI